MNGRMSRGIVLASFLTTMLAVDARADIGPPPQCPDGLHGSYWEGHFCAPTTCASDAECGSQKCVERTVCLYARERSNLPNTDKQWEYKGECGSDPTCGGGTCLIKKVCTTSAAAVPGVEQSGKRGCGCSVPGGGVGATFCVVGLVGGLGLLLGRRRGRPRS